jgi:methylase of polypeptide subunit release factors
VVTTIEERTRRRITHVDPEFSALATGHASELAQAWRSLLRDVYFDQVNRDLRLPRYGGDYDVRPFPLPTSPVDDKEMKRRLHDAVNASRRSADATLARRIQQAFAFFMFGEALRRPALEELFGEGGPAVLDEAVRLGLVVDDERSTMRMNGLSLFSTTLRNGDVIHVFADTPPHFATRTADPRVYVGADSYELMEYVSEWPAISGCCVEMGSGSGIQLIAALKQHRSISSAIGVERDRRALHVSLFNAALNGVGERMTVVNDGDGLRRAVEDRPIAFAMTNPPFLAMPAWIEIDSEDRQALAGLMDIRERDHGFEGDLRTVFPGAGWGGEDGLAVTKQFVDVLVPLLARGSPMVIYSQHAGDADGPSLLREHVRTREGVRFAFERVKSRRLFVKQPESNRVAEGQNQRRLSAGEAAASVARLIVAALMAKKEPRRLRVGIRKDGPEAILLMKFARRLEDCYRRQGITHFHDGFVVLTRAHTEPVASVEGA